MDVTTTVYAEIVKAERNEQGDLVVVGKATGPDLDLDKQICDPTWLGKAMPAWFSTGANIREMHTSIAAGVGTELAQDGDSWMVTATVVDPVSARKVEAGVLKGYSIGIRSPQVRKDVSAPGGRIVGGDIVEVSLVDRPCNPTATLALAKSAKPGMTVKAVDLDRDRMLVKVEELVELPDSDAAPTEDDPLETARSLVAARKAVNPDLGKGTPAEDIAGAQAAIAAIAQLIVSEAGDLATGDLGEACDIQDLLCAIDALRWFICGEADEAGEDAVEPDEDDDVDVLITIPLSDKPDTTKTTKPDDQAALADLVKQAVTEANKSHEAELAVLRDELAKVRALPVPGGPVLTRTSQDTAKAARKDELLTKARQFRVTASQVTDSQARLGYTQLAEQAEHAAQAV